MKLPTEAQLGAALDLLAAQYDEHALLTGSPLQDLLARFLALAVAFKERANFDALDNADWIPHLHVGWGHLLHGRREARAKRKPAPRVLMTVSEVAAVLGWSRERARRWLKATGCPIERIGNKDLVARRDVEKAAKLRLRRRQDKIARRYQSR